MRNPERIDEVLDMIGIIWKKNPDIRFQQLIYTLQSEYSYNHNNVGKIESTTPDGFTQIGYDLFNTEDDQFINYLRERIRQGAQVGNT
ncbi:DUF1040 family protein [Enterovibrio makurazakiensis]|uniref:hypothetical protein n=1 Tax=Enterovibrio makurazakiensis TaxID=2910232 RepID=UPI003D1DE96C